LNGDIHVSFSKIPSRLQLNPLLDISN